MKASEQIVQIEKAMYLIIGLPTGIHTVSVTMDGFEKRVLKEIVVNGSTSPVNIVLTSKEGIIRGRVSDITWQSYPKHRGTNQE